jgi:hypothetical protein
MEFSDANAHRVGEPNSWVGCGSGCVRPIATTNKVDKIAQCAIDGMFQQADEKGLHGKARRHFRSKCLKQAKGQAA